MKTYGMPVGISNAFPQFSAITRRSLRVGAYATAHSRDHCLESQKNDAQFMKHLRIGVCAFAAAAFVSAGTPALAFAAPALDADASLTVAFPASRAKEVNNVQRTLVEAWGVVRETFVDPTYNHQDWDSKLQKTMIEMLPLKTADAAYSKVSGMLESLGDPFTRLISPKEYQSFRISSDGNLQGVGLFVTADTSSGHLRVISSIDGSPADRAGIQAGDELLEIDGEPCEGLDPEQAAQRLRGRVGTSVTIKLLNTYNAKGEKQTREVNLSRETVSLSPVSSSVILHKMPDGKLSKTGYVRLVAFSQLWRSGGRQSYVEETTSQGQWGWLLVDSDAATKTLYMVFFGSFLLISVTCNQYMGNIWLCPTEFMLVNWWHVTKLVHKWQKK